MLLTFDLGQKQVTHVYINTYIYIKSNTSTHIYSHYLPDFQTQKINK